LTTAIPVDDTKHAGLNQLDVRSPVVVFGPKKIPKFFQPLWRYGLRRRLTPGTPAAL
jgi:hypothetical protein